MTRWLSLLFLWSVFGAVRVGDWRILIAFPAAWLVATAVHELGHAIAAWSVGWRVHQIAVWPFVLRWRPLKLCYAPRLSVDASGYMLGLPKSESRIRRWRSIVVSAAGPLASILVILAAILSWRMWGSMTGAPASVRMPVEKTWLGWAYPPFLAIQLIVVIRSLWPFDQHSDGSSILSEIRGRSATPSASAWLLAATGLGVRPRHWPEGLVEAAETTAARDGAATEALLVSLFSALDAAAPDPARMRRALDRIVAAGVPDVAWLVWDAFIAARYENDPDRAERQLARLDAGADGPNVNLARAALAAARGDAAQLEAYAREMKRALREIMPLPTRSYADAIAGMRAQCARTARGER
jgi:hypothetical protein